MFCGPETVDVTHFNVDRSKNVLMLTGYPVAIAID